MRAGNRLGEAEIEDLDRPVRPHLDVGRFQVSMDDADAMCRVERVGDLAGNCQRLVDRHRPVSEPIGEGRPFDQFKDQRLDTAAVLESVDAGNIGMAQRCQGPGFALETGDPLGVARNQVGDDLQRDLSPEPAVPGAVNLTHSACAKGRDDFVRAEPVANREGHAVGRL
jgi:hypothetical protein